MKLFGRRALVTGGSRGVGAALVRAFAAGGAAVAIGHVRDGARAGALVEEIDRLGRKTMAVECDLADAVGVGLMVQAVAASLGGIDVAANVLDISDDAALARLSGERWDGRIPEPVAGVFVVARALYPVMAAEGSGNILIVGAGSAPASAEAATGLAGLARALSAEAAGHAVRANAILPGEAAAVAATAVRLASDEGGAAAGECLPPGEAGG